VSDELPPFCCLSLERRAVRVSSVVAYEIVYYNIKLFLTLGRSGAHAVSVRIAAVVAVGSTDAPLRPVPSPSSMSGAIKYMLLYYNVLFLSYYLWYWPFRSEGGPECSLDAFSLCSRVDSFSECHLRLPSMTSYS